MPRVRGRAATFAPALLDSLQTPLNLSKKTPVVPALVVLSQQMFLFFCPSPWFSSPRCRAAPRRSPSG